MLTIRQELAKRLRVYWRVYRKRPDSYNATLGIGRIQKNKDRPFSGSSINGKIYFNGVTV